MPARQSYAVIALYRRRWTAFNKGFIFDIFLGFCYIFSEHNF
jgi:hypothetical protein